MDETEETAWLSTSPLIKDSSEKMFQRCQTRDLFKVAVELEQCLKACILATDIFERIIASLRELESSQQVQE